MEHCLKFIVPGEPQGKARPRVVRRGKGMHAYTPQETKNYEAIVRYCANKARQQHGIIKPISGEIGIGIKAYLKMPPRCSKKKAELYLSGQARPNKKPDSDNIAKAILDGLNPEMKLNSALHKMVCIHEGLYDDDKQVISLNVEKYYSDNPRIEVTAVWHEE